ncbi:Bro-N domain-containing protein [Polaromonas sp. C04]|uniref:BRO-N domain-containing protein n=1 Tax=Polaromonas sp. C04 TaxID=1945857 RepID=UPI0009867198|nr:Bro-N domain-containing protein [Polaromonas sp. C04]OOG51666.1 phage antirepressor protein [Polaromonas sp. C04]
MSKDIGSSRDVALFQEKAIRRTWHDSQWWFAVVDVVAVLTDSRDPAQYINRIRLRDKELAQGWVHFVHPLRIETEGGQQSVNCANTEGLLRIIQSIPSPKAEPFKRWLAKVGYERIQEIENPELASARARELYEAKGYPKPWIEKRLRSIAIRGELTDEWKQRGVKEGQEYAILTAEIASATFGVTPEGHKKIKGLAKLKTGDNLRDHMTDLELIFTMLGEASTTEIARRKDARGFPANRSSARAGGTIAGDARKALEAKSGQPVVSASNNLALQAPGAAALAVTAFVETQARELASKTSIGQAAARKKVAARTAKAVASLKDKPTKVKKS